MSQKVYELSPEAMERKRQYIKRYNKATYKVYTFKLRTEDDATLIDAIKNSGDSICALTKKALEAYLIK